jgi:hypothetical protein
MMFDYKKYLLNKYLAVVIMVMITIGGFILIVHYTLFVGCSPHYCGATTYTKHNYGKNETICEVLLYDYRGKTQSCFSGCMEHITDFPIGTIKNFTCYVLDGDYDNDIWECNIQDTVKLPLLSPICEDLFISSMILLYLIVPIYLIFCCGCAILICGKKSEYQDLPVNISIATE